MPELPEVETIKRDLQDLIVGRKIEDVSTDTPKQVQPDLAAVKKAVVGKEIVGLERQAKVLLIKLEGKEDEVSDHREHRVEPEYTEGVGVGLAFHLKLTGRLLVRDKGEPKDDWQHVTFSLSGDKELRFCDLRKFGWIKLVTSNEWRVMSQEFGPEPGKDLDLAGFKRVLASTVRPVKVLIMDQKKIAGVGNIYACDALFLAKIDPRRPAKSLTDGEAKKLYEAILKVLKAGIKYRGASDQYYLDALGHKGHYQEHFLVYGRKGKDCPDCPGKVERTVVGGRGTFWCPACQR